MNLILVYTEDYDHSLPGPCDGNVRASYNKKDLYYSNGLTHHNNQLLANYLANYTTGVYLNHHKDFNPLLICPGNSQVELKLEPHIRPNYNLLKVNEKHVFGRRALLNKKKKPIKGTEVFSRKLYFIDQPETSGAIKDLLINKKMPHIPNFPVHQGLNNQVNFDSSIIEVSLEDYL